mmetsp:Transcript_31256/g.83259  ORF Transcript_31256/g.83259 Transcript_31256/m.83259 type:complete len:154 (+) Transcript_31256:40-501(+)
MLPVVQGYHAMPSGDRRQQPRVSIGSGGSAAPGGMQPVGDGQRPRPPGSGAAMGQRRSRKKNRRTDAVSRGKYDKECKEVHLHVEASGLQRDARDDPAASGSDSELPVDGMSAAPPHRDSVVEKAERKGILQKLNSKVKPPSTAGGDAPKSLH